MGKRNWLRQAVAIDGDSVVIQSGGSTSGNVTGNVTGDGNTVVQSGSDGTYVNGRKVSSSGGSINVINGKVYIDGEPVD